VNYGEKPRIPTIQVARVKLYYLKFKERYLGKREAEKINKSCAARGDDAYKNDSPKLQSMGMEVVKRGRQQTTWK